MNYRERMHAVFSANLYVAKHYGRLNGAQLTLKVQTHLLQFVVVLLYNLFRVSGCVYSVAVETLSYSTQLFHYDALGGHAC